MVIQLVLRKPEFVNTLCAMEITLACFVRIVCVAGIMILASASVTDPTANWNAFCQRNAFPLARGLEHEGTARRVCGDVERVNYEFPVDPSWMIGRV